jgi:hypothetical protein
MWKVESVVLVAIRYVGPATARGGALQVLGATMNLQTFAVLSRSGCNGSGARVRRPEQQSFAGLWSALALRRRCLFQE